MNWRTSAVLLAIVGGLVGCGDALVDSTYRGEPILRLVGRISSVRGDPVPSGADVLVSMFWNTDLSSTPPTLVEQQSVSTNIQFPNEFEVLVFDPPTEDHLLAADPRLAVGFLLVYADVDGDRTFSGPDEIIGGNVSKALVWALEDIAAADSPFTSEVPTGFSLINLPGMACDVRSPDDSKDDRREPPPVPACSSDATCPPEFTCDTTFNVCVPEDGFELVIGEDFDLDRATCH